MGLITYPAIGLGLLRVISNLQVHNGVAQNGDVRPC